MNRVLATARLQPAHPLVTSGIPWLVVSISFAMYLAIWARPTWPSTGRLQSPG